MSMPIDIPQYPQARFLQREDKPLFDRLLEAADPEISEYTFTNLYSWRESYGFGVSVFKDRLVPIASISGTQCIFPALGESLTKEDIFDLLSRGAKLIRAPDRLAQIVSGDARFIVTLDRDNCDYVYKVDQLQALKGAKYDGKRNLIKNFKNHYRYEYVAISEPSTIEECVRFEESWCVFKDCDHVEGLDKERDALSQMLNNFFEFGLVGGVIKVDARVCAVTIAERLNRHTLVLHIAKADSALTGLYQLMMQEFLTREAGGYTFVNMEQDLGVEGLRKAKLSYHPDRLINKYTIALAGGNAQV
ncbi:MAG: phosphatidylglycerol lysyltransferase domain-containing protein [Candidatus Omnitrophota bacterium]